MSVDTKGLLILPREWRKLRAEYLEKDLKETPSVMKFATIRANSQRPGEIRFRHADTVGSITLVESFTPQKRWYQAVVYSNEIGQIDGYPVSETLYFFIDPWLLNQFLQKAAKAAKKEARKAQTR